MKINDTEQIKKDVEHLALNPFFKSYYETKDCYKNKLSLQQLLTNAGCLYCENKHISRTMIFPN